MKAERQARRQMKKETKNIYREEVSQQKKTGGASATLRGPCKPRHSPCTGRISSDDTSTNTSIGTNTGTYYRLNTTSTWPCLWSRPWL